MPSIRSVIATVPRTVALTLCLFAVAGCDSVADAFVARCQAVTGAASSTCQCAAGKVKEVMGDDYWRIFGLVLSNDRNSAETEMAKLGLGGMFSFMGKYAAAAGVAESQCGIRGLSRM